MEIDFHNHTNPSIQIWRDRGIGQHPTSGHEMDMHATNTSVHPLVNYSEELDLLLHMGQRRRDLISVTILLIVYSLIFVSGTVGNICTCIVIVKNQYMHTSTNFYLFSLAISDVLILVFGLPFEAFTIWEAYPYRFGEFFCIFKSFLMEATSYASVITITAFTIERYIAICFPLKSHKMTDLRRSAKIIIVIWVFSAICALPYPIHTRTFYYLTNPHTNTPIKDSYMCNIPPEWHIRMSYMFQISTFIFFVLPMTVITVLYIMIAITLKRTSLIRANSEDSTTGHNHSHSMKSVLRMLIAVVVAFFLCWAPFHIQRLYTLYKKEWTAYSLEVSSHLFYISGVLYFVSSTVNPILYNLMSRRYRQAFRETLCCCFMKRTSKYERSLVYYHNNMKAQSNGTCSSKRKTNPKYRIKQYEHSNCSDGCMVSNNMIPDVHSCPASVRLLPYPPCESTYEVPISKGYSRLLKTTNSYTDCVNITRNDVSLLKYNFLSKSDNTEIFSKAKNNVYAMYETNGLDDTYINEKKQKVDLGTHL